MSLNIRNRSKQIQRPHTSDQLNDNNFDNYNEIHLSDNNNNICFLDNENNNSNNSYSSEDNNSYNNSDYNNIYLFENNNNSDYSYLFEDNNNNSDYSDLSKDDNNNNSDYSDFSEDDNNSDVEMDIEEETNFENITSLMLFTWITKHMIGNSTYKDLVNIINNEDFNPIDVPKNIQTLKEQRKHFPLHKIRKNVVNINKEKTSSNSQLTKMAYSISIIDHIRTILNNSQIASRLYFGPGIETDKKSEFWHGTYNTGTSIIFKSDINNEKIFFGRIRAIVHNEDKKILIKEILYKKSGTEATWITRHIKFRHFLPLEYIQEPKNLKNLLVKKIFLDLYFDDFGTYRTVYHSLGDVYIQIGNMPFDLRKLLKNHFIIGFVPFGASFNEFIKPFVRDIQLLEKGIPMKINNIEYLIIGGLGVVTADLPQENNLCGIKRHNANYGYRNCFVFREQLSDKNYNCLQNAYTYHAISGKIARLMEITMDLLSESGKKLFIKNWKYFEFPSTWLKMPSPTSHSQLRIFPEFKNLPNMHINFHLIQHALSYVNLINISVGVKEIVHRIFKNFAPHTNKKKIDFDLIKRYITMEGIRNFFDNNPNYKNFNLFNDWYITSGLNISEDSLTISAYSKYKGFSTAKKKEIQNFNLNNILIHLFRAYTNQLKKKGLLTNKKIKFHNSIYYEMKNENGAINKIKIKSGDVIEIEEETIEKLTYAIVRAIISHKGSENNLLGGCSQFKLCDNEKWDVIFLINIVDQQQRVHFVHNCTTVCKIGEHNSSDIFYKNEFFFHPV
ncbi:hypothetical protein Glove_123g115 [Diversispora epigaea]|uniref:BAH domain-containing protein n=1 Tax=Diversispora epigaea TaxID=1348612 RepID=A0A397J1D4_9GLOM|nr:hypothetical protein Glove_123g115 [Diversispora epigaea]